MNATASMRERAIFPIAIVSLLLCGSSAASHALPLVQLASAELPDPHPAVASARTCDFVRDAAYASEYLIAAARLADNRARSAGVRAYARDILRDGTETNDALKATVWQADIDVATPTSLDMRHHVMMRKLDALASREFDSLFLQQQIQVLAESLHRLEAYAGNGDNRRLRQFALEAATRSHDSLQSARQLAASREHLVALRY